MIVYYLGDHIDYNKKTLCPLCLCGFYYDKFLPINLAMPNSIMYSEDAFVLLETNLTEQFLSPEELLEKLKEVLQTYQEDLPQELSQFFDLEEQAKYLRDNFCELDVGAGKYLQWYAVRLEK
jgi:hypothetical protein